MSHVLFEAFAPAPGTDIAAVRASVRQAQALPGADGGWVGAPAPGSINAGALLARTLFADEAAYHRWTADGFWQAAGAGLRTVAIARDAIFYRSAAGNSRLADDSGIWRGLVFATLSHAPRAQVAALESALLGMPAQIGQIRAWRLSHAIESHGARSWTHMWEQELDSIDDLRGPYLLHPLHWGHVDAWFDIDCPQWIVDPYAIHCFAPTGDAVRL